MSGEVQSGRPEISVRLRDDAPAGENEVYAGFSGFLDLDLLLCRAGRNRLPLDEQPLLPRSLFQTHEGKRSNEYTTMKAEGNRPR
jgi:hypothetical protein